MAYEGPTFEATSEREYPDDFEVEELNSWNDVDSSSSRRKSKASVDIAQLVSGRQLLGRITFEQMSTTSLPAGVHAELLALSGKVFEDGFVDRLDRCSKNT